MTTIERTRPSDAPASPSFNTAQFLLDRVTHEPSGAGWITRCPVPAHEDRTASLSIGVGEDGRLLLHCFAGCSLDAILRGLNLATTDLFPDREGRRISAIYDYGDAERTLLRQVLRYEPKYFKQRRPDGAGGWVWNVEGVPDTLYRLPDIPHEAASCYIVEGERDVERLLALGEEATTNAGGAGKWRNTHTQQLVQAGVTAVVILPDHDEPGRRHAETVARSCHAVGLRVRVLALPGLLEKQDVSDWFDSGHTGAELVALAESAAEWAPTVETVEVPEDDADEPIKLDETLELRSDVGNARRLVARHGDMIRYAVAPVNAWLVWDNRRWRPDLMHEVTRYAKDTVRAAYHETVDSAAADREAWARHWLRSESSARILAMVEMAKSEPRVIVRPSQFDRDEWLLNVENGTLDLRTGTLRDHRPEDWMTRLAPVRFDPSATCPRWETFLAQILVSPELIGYVQRVLGYCLTGSIREQKLWLLHGHGQNGKSTLIETVRAVLGEEQYAGSTPPNTLLAKSTDAIPSDIAKIVGARFVTAVETEKGKYLSEALIKALTGGDLVNTRKMYADWFSFRPTFKLLMATNHRPKVKGTDDGIWRRLHYIPFTVRVPDTQVDPNLPETLRAEAPGILNWMLAGCLDWQQRKGLHPPTVVTEATQAYRLAQDALGKFLDEATDRSLTEARCPARALYKAYQTWCEQTGEHAATERDFGEALEEKGIEKRRSNGKRFWRGVRLLPEFAGSTGMYEDETAA